MAVVLDNAAEGEGVAVSSLSFLHQPSGTPTKIGLSISTGGVRTITSVTYGGVAMTLETSVGGGGAPLAAIYGLANPPSGDQTVAITLSGNDDILAVSVSVTGGSTALCFSNHGTNSGTSNSATATTTSATGDLVMSAFTAPGAVGVTPGAGETGLIFNSPVGSSITGGSSVKDGAASITFTDALSGSVAWKLALASFAQSAPAGGSPVYSAGASTAQSTGAALAKAATSSIAAAVSSGTGAALASGASTSAGASTATAAGASTAVGAAYAAGSSSAQAQSPSVPSGTDQIISHTGLPGFGTTSFLVSDGRPIARFGTTTNGLTDDGEVVFHLPPGTITAAAAASSVGTSSAIMVGKRRVAGLDPNVRDGKPRIDRQGRQERHDCRDILAILGIIGRLECADRSDCEELEIEM